MNRPRSSTSQRSPLAGLSTWIVGSDGEPGTRSRSFLPPISDSRTILTRQRSSCLLALSAMLLIVAPTGAAVKPKPWQWTPAQAATAIRSYGDELSAPSDLVGVTCRGTGKKVSGRFVTFRCRVTLEDKQLTLNARTRRSGGLCFAASVVPSDCLATGKRARGSLTDVARAVYAKFGAPAQTFTATAHGSGFYSWTWVSGEVMHRGTVTFTASGPVLKVFA